MVSLLVYQRWENKVRDRGKRDKSLEEEVGEDMLGYRHPGFRYTL